MKPLSKAAARRQRMADQRARHVAQAQIVEVATQLAAKGLPVISAYVSGDRAAIGFQLPGGDDFSERYVCKLPLSQATVEEVERRFWEIAA